MTDGTPKKSDLGTRTISAIVMVAVAGAALWLGGWLWTIFVAAVALGVLYEWAQLARGFCKSPPSLSAWISIGVAYVGLAGYELVFLRHQFPTLYPLLEVVLGVIATDVGAYTAGRTFGGPKIAPSISPSKTWSGLAGGMIAAALVMVAITWLEVRHSFSMEGGCATSRTCPAFADQAIPVALSGFVLAIVAQAGDFFESWMKRRAGVKDSGHLIPGHGGLFDRVDGLMAVAFISGFVPLVVALVASLMGESLLPSPA